MASEVEVARGIWHPPGSNKALEAALLVDGRRLAVRLPDRSLVGEETVGGMVVSDRIGRIPRRITFADGGMFETEDNDAIEMLLTAHRRNRGLWIHELERFHPRLIGLVVLVFLLSGLIYRYALPALVEVAVWATPPVVSDMMSSGTLASLDKALLGPTKLSTAEQRKIRDRFNEIAGFSSRGRTGYVLHFRDGGYIGPNAFALPDGALVLTDQLVTMAAGDTEMILGVLAHEIGHVEKHHALRQMYRAAGTAGLIMLIAGDIGSGGEEILTDGAALLALSYSRGSEAEADRVSVELMYKAGHDPRAIGRFFKLLEDKLGDKGGTNMLSTHPGTPERRQAIDDYARQVEGK
ncbi:MAG: peptidase family protein [Rhizobium sp.]|nr:peptidase family protein [Rhizobium sp.]